LAIAIDNLILRRILSDLKSKHKNGVYRRMVLQS